MDVRELIRERVKLHEECKATLDRAERERRTLTPSEQTEFDRKQARVTELRRMIDAKAAVADEERALGESRGRQTVTTVHAEAYGRAEREQRSQAALAFRGWALGPRHAKPEHIAAAENLGLRHESSELELRALSVGTTDAGGYSVPDSMMSAFWEAQKALGRVRNLSTVLSTSSGSALPIPTMDDTSNTGEIINEAGAVTTTADPVVGQIVLDSFKYSSKAVIVSVELLQDSSINLPQYLGRALGTRIARIQNAHFTTGDGSGKPRGVVTAASLGKTAAATNAVTFDEVIDLTHSLDDGYRSRPGVSFMMNDTIAAYVRKLKDSQNRYLWELSTQAGISDKLNGYPVVINPDMTGTQTTAAKIMLFGDFSAYHIRDAGGPVFARADELRILNHQVCFLAYQRTDGDLVDANAVRYLRNA